MKRWLQCLVLHAVLQRQSWRCCLVMPHNANSVLFRILSVSWYAPSCLAHCLFMISKFMGRLCACAINVYQALSPSSLSRTIKESLVSRLTYAPTNAPPAQKIMSEVNLHLSSSSEPASPQIFASPVAPPPDCRQCCLLIHPLAPRQFPWLPPATDQQNLRHKQDVVSHRMPEEKPTNPLWVSVLLVLSVGSLPAPTPAVLSPLQ